MFSFNEKTVLRGGWGLYYSPWNYPAAGTTGWGQIGYSATTMVPQPTRACRRSSMSNPFPSGLVANRAATRLGLLTGVGGDVYFVDPNKGAPRVQQYSVDLQRELPGGVSVSVGYTGLTGTQPELGRIGQRADQHQPARSEVPEPLVADTSKLVPNPFFGVAAAGSVRARAPRSSSASCCVRSRSSRNVYMQQSTGAHSQYNAGIFQMRKRVTGLWGGTFSYTYSRLNDNQFGESNYYSSAPGLQNNYTVIPGSPYYNPDQEYGRSLLDSPHKVVIAPTLMLPFGEGKKFMADSGVGDVAARRLVDHAGRSRCRAGFPLGVSQNITGTAFLYGGTQRPNIVAGQDILVAGRHHRSHHREHRPTTSICNKAAFSTAPTQHVRQRAAHAPASTRRGATTSTCRSARTSRRAARRRSSVRLEVLNMFNIVQWAAPASSRSATRRSARSRTRRTTCAWCSSRCDSSSRERRRRRERIDTEKRRNGGERRRDILFFSVLFSVAPFLRVIPLPPSPPLSPGRRAAALVALAFLTVAAYGNSFTAGFPFDNKQLILQDARVHDASAANVDAILHHSYWWPYGESGLYRPVTTLSYLFNYAVLGNGGRPAGYHWFNLAVHIVNVWLVLAGSMRRADGASAATSPASPSRGDLGRSSPLDRSRHQHRRARGSAGRDGRARRVR